jgi:hypothetical protein
VIGRAIFALQRLAGRRGPRGDSRVWTGVWVLLFTARQIRKRTGRSAEDVVFRQELQPGESLIITHTTDTYG